LIKNKYGTGIQDKNERIFEPKISASLSLPKEGTAHWLEILPFDKGELERILG